MKKNISEILNIDKIESSKMSEKHSSNSMKISLGSMPALPQTLSIPLKTPIEASSGVLGTFAVYSCPVFSSTSRRSEAKFPPEALKLGDKHLVRGEIAAGGRKFLKTFRKKIFFMLP